MLGCRDARNVDLRQLVGPTLACDEIRANSDSFPVPVGICYSIVSRGFRQTALLLVTVAGSSPCIALLNVRVARPRSFLYRCVANNIDECNYDGGDCEWIWAASG